MASFASRVVGLAILAAFIVLFIYTIEYVLWFLAAVLLLLILGGLLFYFRMRLALRRFRRAFAQANEALSRRAGANRAGGQPPGPGGQGPPREGDVLDAEFRVEDGSGRDR